MRARQAATPQRPRPAGRVFRNPNLRWTAQRPPEARPAPRRGPVGPRGAIPRYTHVPRWGLGNLDPSWHATDDPRDAASGQLTQALTIAAAVFAGTAVVHLVRYVVVSVNRTVVLPGWLDWVTSWLVVAAGVAAMATTLVAAVMAARWIIAVRSVAYRDVGRVDPRPWWQLWTAMLIPLVNVVGPAWLLYEIADLDADAAALARRRRRMQRMWVAWVIVNVVAAVTILYRWYGESIQAQADALFLVIVSAAVSAVFCWWIRYRLPAVFDAPQEVAVSTRWVVVQ